jgi:hypothetical protein
VFDAITDWRAFPTWRSDVKSVREFTSADGHVGWIEVSRHGELPMEIVESQRPTKLIGHIASDKLPFGGTWTWQIDPVSSKECTATVTEDGEIYNPLFRFMARYLFGYTATMDGYLRNLGKKFGEEVAPRS